MDACHFARLFFRITLLLTPLALPTGGMAQQWPVATLMGHTRGIRSVAFSLDGKLLASGSEENTIRIWDVASGLERRRLDGHKGVVSSIAFSPDGKTLASGSYDETIKLWDFNTGEELATFEKTYLPYCIGFSSDGKTLASTSSQGISVWDLATHKVKSSLASESFPLLRVAFSPDGKLLAGAGGRNYSFEIWDVGTGKIKSAQSRGKGIPSSYCVAFSHDSKVLAWGGDDYTVTLLHMSTGIQQTISFNNPEKMPPYSRLHGPPRLVYSVAFSPDSRLLAVASYDCAVKVWSLKKGNKPLSLVGNDDMVWSVAFSPDGKLLASGGGDGTVRLWRITAED
jgi:WD40 repeat protein